LAEGYPITSMYPGMCIQGSLLRNFSRYVFGHIYLGTIWGNFRIVIYK